MAEAPATASAVGTFPRRRFLGTALAAALAAPLSVAAPLPGRFRVAFLWPGDERQARKLTEDVLSPLRRYGYVEGENLTAIVHWTSVGPERIERELIKLRGEKVNALVVYAGSALWATATLKDVPIVAWNATDPVAEGLARSLAHPGGMITGTHSGTEGIARRQMQVLRKLVPDLAGVTCFGYGPNAGNQEIELIASAVREAGLRFRVVHARSSERLQVLEACRREGFQAVIYPSPPSPWSPENTRRHADSAIRGRVALAGFFENLAENGFLLAVGEQEDEFSLRIAIQLERVLRGAKPAETPFIGPSRYFTTVNRSTAKALGLAIAPDLALIVDRLFD